MSAYLILQIVAALGAGLTAGIFYAFSTFVMKALGRLPPEHGIAAMQSINIAVINPFFFAVFFGTPFVCALTAVMAIWRGSEPGAATVLIASLLTILGSLGVTMAFNVPLNNQLARIAPASHEGAELWKRYLVDWTFWNHVRTIVPLIATALFIIAIWRQGPAG